MGWLGEVKYVWRRKVDKSGFGCEFELEFEFEFEFELEVG